MRRELSNQTAEIEFEFRDVDSAIERLTLEHDDPRLFIVHLGNTGELDTLKRLSGTFAGRPILVLLNGAVDSTVLVQAMRNGASQVVMLPLVTAEFIEALDGILVQFSHLSQIVVLDVPSTLDDQQLAVLNSADKVVVLAEQTIPSLQLTIELLQLGLRAHSPTVVINRYDSSNGFEISHLRQVLSVEDVLTVANDSEGFHHARNQGQPLRLASPRSRAISDIDSIIEQLLGKNLCKPPKGHEGFISRFTHLLGV